MEQELEQPELIQEIDSPERKIQSVSDLPGIGAATLTKLETAGYIDLMSIAIATPGELIGATEMSEATAKK